MQASTGNDFKNFYPVDGKIMCLIVFSLVSKVHLARLVSVNANTLLWI